MPRNPTKKRATEAIFESYGLPGWLGWGTAGAESTYGTNGSYAFGGIDLPNSGNGNYWVEARESAKAYKGLVEQYGSIAAAVPHYSGNSYTVTHVKELARQGSSQGGEVIDVGLAEDLFGGGEVGKIGENLLNPLHLEPFNHGKAKGLELLPGGGNVSPGEYIGGIGQSLVTVAELAKVAGELLFTPEGWLRIGKMLGGAIFFVWGLERLISGSSPGSGKVSGLAKDAAIAAVVK